MKEMFQIRYITLLAPSEDLLKGLRNSSHFLPPRIIENLDHKPAIKNYAKTPSYCFYTVFRFWLFIV